MTKSLYDLSRKLNLLLASLFLMASFASTGCSDNDDDSTTNATPCIVGTWQYTLADPSLDANTRTTTYQFRADGTYRFTQSRKVDEQSCPNPRAVSAGTYQVSGTTLSINTTTSTLCGANDPDGLGSASATFTCNENTLVLGTGSDAETLTRQ